VELVVSPLNMLYEYIQKENYKAWDIIEDIDYVLGEIKRLLTEGEL
jgi:hypothetical protein